MKLGLIICVICWNQHFSIFDQVYAINLKKRCTRLLSKSELKRFKKKARNFQAACFIGFEGCCWLSPSPRFANKQSVRSLYIWKKVHITPEGYSSKQGKEMSPCSQACGALPSLSLLSLLQPHKYCLEMVLAILRERSRRCGAVSNNPPSDEKARLLLGPVPHPPHSDILHRYCAIWRYLLRA